MRMRLWVVVGVVLLGVLAAVGEVRAKHIGLNGKEDFAEIARRGFFETITNGGTFQPNNATDATASALSPQPPGYNTYLNRQRNSYTWSSGWFGGKYYVGTVRDVGCFLINPDDPLCPVVNADGFPEPGSDQRAEIWALTPSGTSANTGSWTRVLQSPCIVAGGGFAVSACQGFPNLGVAANLPRDIGYRGMTVSTNTVGDPADLPLDASPRLWVGAFGLGGRILHSTNGTTFSVASVNGLATIPSITSLTGLTALQNISTVDLGYRSVLIWQGRVCIAPAGSYEDEDLPVNPTVLCNSNPASTSSTWQTIVNVKTQPGLVDPNNLGIFQMGVFNGDLYIGVSNRTTGVQVWRLPASQCPIPTSSSTVCVANSPQWQRVITAGGGRPLTSEEGGLPDSAGVSAMQVHNGGGGDALYIGTSDAAVFQNSRAELFRVNGDGTWDLIVGMPRKKSVMDAMNADLALAANFNCLTTVNTNRTQFDFDGSSGPNPAEDACFPLANMAAGFGTGPSGGTAPATGGYSSGPFGYLWRMAVHDDGSTDLSTTGNFLYLGTLHTGGGNSGGGQGNPSGFDLLKSKNGVTWNTADNTVNNNGLDNSNNYGVRTLASVPNWPNSGPGGVGAGPALLLGTANPSTEEGDDPPHGGAEVHLGTCAPNSTPTAVASVTTKSSAPGQVIFDGTKYIAFDDENFPSPPGTGAAGNNTVNVTLVGSGSSATFCGDLLSYQWYDQLGGYTGTPGGALPDVGASGSTSAGGAKLTIPSLTLALGTGVDITDYTFRLVVTDEFSQTAFIDVNVRASHNLPPTAAIQSATGVPPFVLSTGNNPTWRVTLIDGGGDGFETIPVQGKCSDPESLLAVSPPSCTWTAESEVTGQTFPLEDFDPADFITSYNMTAPVSGGGGGGGGGGDDIFLTATDDHGYTGSYRVQMRVRAAVHDVVVTAVAATTSPATVGTTQNVNVTVRNDGHFTETFNVTLVDAAGGSPIPPQPVTLAGCVDPVYLPTYTIPLTTCPSQVLTFSWTPTAPAGQPHTLTATAATVTGETDTADNIRSVSVPMINQAPTATSQDPGPATNEDTALPITLAGTDLDGDPLTYQVVTGPSHGTLTGGTLANRTYTPTLNYNGPDNFTFTVSDGTATSAPATVSITVNAVNDAPSFTKGGNQTVSAVAGAQTVVGWATSISPGPADESGQVLNFIIASNTNSALFTGQPAIAPNGTLTFTPLSTAPTGTATVGVQLHDDGSGTAPNANTSAIQTFTITVNGISTFAAPTGVTATLTGTPRQVHLVWTDNATVETSYQVQRCRISFGTCSYSTITGSPFAANTTSINSTVSSAGTYRFRVRACRTSGSPLCTSYGVSNNIAVP